METQQAPDTSKDYDGYGDIRREIFDVNETIKPQPVCPEEPITEAWGDNPLVDKLDGVSSLYSISKVLDQHAKDGSDSHHQILDVIDKHAPKIPHEDDEHLNHYLRSVDSITPEVHARVFDTLSKHANIYRHRSGSEESINSQYLINKYSWVLHHSPNEAPKQNNKEDAYLDEKHLEKYSKDFEFNGGRVMTHKTIGSRHHLNHDGSHMIIKGTFDERTPNEFPHVPDDFANVSDYHKSELDSLHTPHILGAIGMESVVRRYTEDSKHINKTAAEINKGHGDPEWEGRDNNDRDVVAMSKAVNSAPTYPHKFTVYTGLSKSTNPAQAEYSSAGKKTVHLKAFTSTSLDERLARTFAVPTTNKNPNIHQSIHDLLEIHVPANHKGGLYVDRVSENKGESEYVLDHGTRVEHDAEPKYFANNDRLFRVWKNGNIVGNRKHEDFAIEQKDPAEHTPEYVSRLQDSQLPSHRKVAAGSPAATHAHLNESLKDRIHSVRFNAAANPNASGEQLHKAIKDSHSSVVGAALDNPNVTIEHLTKAQEIDLDNIETRAKIAKHPLADSNIISNALKDPAQRVRFEAIKNENGNVTEDHLKIAVKDRDETVRRAAKYKLGLLNEEIVELMLKATEVLGV